MLGSLRQAQTTVKRDFAPHALDWVCAPCKLPDMRVKLEQIRDQRGLRLEDIAEQLGVAISTIQRWEKQTMSIPSERLENIARAYGCRISDIFDDGLPSQSPVPSDDDLESMIETAMRELPPGVTYTRALASSLRAQLQLYSRALSSGAESALAKSRAPGATARSRPPTKRSARG